MLTCGSGLDTSNICDNRNIDKMMPGQCNQDPTASKEITDQ